MKKLHYILAPFMAAAVLVACNTQPAGPTDAELTAQVDAKVEEVKAKLKSDCDANLRNAASMMKDSIIMSATTTPAPAAAKPAPVAVKPTPKPTPKPAPAPVKPTPKPEPPKPATVGNGKPAMGTSSNDPNTTGNGKPMMGGNRDEKGNVNTNQVGNGKPKMGGGN
jgi:outer membrane biosynthesis protein TonB